MNSTAVSADASQPSSTSPPRQDFTVGICIDDDCKLISRLKVDLTYDRSGTRPASPYPQANAHLPRR